MPDDIKASIDGRKVNTSPKCIIKIFLESDKFSHKAGVTKHATSSLVRKSYVNAYGSNKMMFKHIKRLMRKHVRKDTSINDLNDN